MSSQPRVLFVTGAYAPEFSAGGLQCRAVAQALGARVVPEVLTTATNPALPVHDVIDDVPVSRVAVGKRGRLSSGRAAVRLVIELARLLPRMDAVHIQGFSSKNVAVTASARLFRRPVILHLQTSRHDEPPAIRSQGSMAWWAFSSAARFISVSPGLKASAIAGGIPADKIVVIPNGVDAERFRPAPVDERRALRAELGLPLGGPLILFVGVISPDKQPHVLLDAWASLQGDPATRSSLVFVGATNPDLYELGDRLVDTLRATVSRQGLEDRVCFAEPTPEVEKYFRAADTLVMPSIREGCPNVLLEAMACGLPVVASRLAGATDAIIDDGANGVLVTVGDVSGFAVAIGGILRDPAAAARMGEAARRTILERFTIGTVAGQWLQVYMAV